MRIRLTVALAILVAALGLAACGDDDGGLDSGGGEEVTTAAAEGEASGTLKVSNWPFYIDRKTIPDFFGKVQPQLEQGEAGGRDIMVVTDWMANKMHDLGYLQNLDQEAVAPAKENLITSLQSPSIDPDQGSDQVLRRNLGRETSS